MYEELGVCKICSLHTLALDHDMVSPAACTEVEKLLLLLCFAQLIGPCVIVVDPAHVFHAQPNCDRDPSRQRPPRSIRTELKEAAVAPASDF